MREFSPPPRLQGGHRMTIYAWARRRAYPGLPAPEPRYFDVEPDTRVLAACHWQARPADHPTLVTLHGLEGSSDAHYMAGLAHKAFPRGFNVVRLNQRNCGGTEHLSTGLYHSGLTKDVIAVCTELASTDGLPAIVVSGYSLGGNLALRMAGLYADAPPPWLRAVAAVSPTLELDECMRAMERPENRIYEWHFMHSLRRRIRKKARQFPGRFDIRGLWRVWRIRDFDDRFTAPHHGFRDAADYYYQMASARVIDRVRVPALVIAAEDDPFIPVEPFLRPGIAGNPHVEVRITRFGGHCGFVEAPCDGYDGYWAEREIVDFFAARL